MAALKALDYSTLLLIYSTLNDSEKLGRLYQLACKLLQLICLFLLCLVEGNRLSIAYQSAVLMQDHEAVINALIKGEREVEAAFYARNYYPQAVEKCVRLWKQKLNSSKNPQHAKFAVRVADPVNHPDLFPSVDKVIFRCFNCFLLLVCG